MRKPDYDIRIGRKFLHVHFYDVNGSVDPFVQMPLQDADLICRKIHMFNLDGNP